jgi:hypothetical protein
MGHGIVGYIDLFPKRGPYYQKKSGFENYFILEFSIKAFPFSLFRFLFILLQNLNSSFFTLSSFFILYLLFCISRLSFLYTLHTSSGSSNQQLLFFYKHNLPQWQLKRSLKIWVSHYTWLYAPPLPLSLDSKSDGPSVRKETRKRMINKCNSTIFPLFLLQWTII